MTRRLLQISLLVLLGYTAIVTVVYLNQEALIFHPDRTLRGDPGKAGMPYEDVWLATSDGTKIHGWYVPLENARGTVLLAHGNAGNISDRISSLRFFRDMGYAAFTYDYRGYGQSEGSPTEEGLYMDTQAAWEYLTQTRGTKPEDIILYGRSLGGGAVSWLAARTSPHAIVIESSYTRLADAGAHRYPWLPVHWLSIYEFPTIENVTKFQAPLLIAHSPADDIIPFEQGKAVYDAYSGPKRFVELDDLHHLAFRKHKDRIRRAWQEFIPNARSTVSPAP